MKRQFQLKVIFRGQDLILRFSHRGGNILFANYHVRTDDGFHDFVTTYEAGKFVISNVKSKENNNMYFDEMVNIMNENERKIFE